MKLNKTLLSLLALAPLSFANAAIDVNDAYARATAPNATTSAVFATIENTSDHARTLVKANSQAAAVVELHDVVMDGEVMQMRQVESIEIPANGHIMLKPGSLHIMLLDINEPLIETQTIDVELTFANGEVQVVTVPVKKVMAGMSKMKHAHH
ncbi:copper chaperone PCu(A)C [Vibrio methylphosphonaticus]|uniref:copper chaperone PCu(A)C n=1 Tax=Vibrio methylphosphonaticus TaxID=2946866 RepID=UPI00202A8028|nr:copper chaperone PCu(A)C [Vibrio methylphosphonaticus]MCL9776944.1 copper chaperone PCu(A)C [Vibrio methylphosphonaticus]